MHGGVLISIETTLYVLGIVILSAFASSAIVCFIVSFVKTMGAYTTISIILGTLIGFLIGAYICIGDLPNSIQWIIKCFPCAHAAVLFRQLLMEEPIAEGFAGLPDETLLEFKTSVGVIFEYGDWRPKMWFHILVLIGSGVIFYVLAIINMSRKVKKY